MDHTAPPGVRIRNMTADDCAAVTLLRARGWRAAYTGLVPGTYLDAVERDVAEDAERRRASLARGGPLVNLVAERPGPGLIGWACYGPLHRSPAPPGRGELYALYVAPEQIGTGAGRALMAEVLARAAAEELRELELWVLRGNVRARRFYERAGFGADGTEESFEADGAQVPEVRYVRTPGDR
ncbi:GNAT family N-acetyltransferase [Streptomyces sp. NPDC057499]|uniref:GNAT family N-acetyltransferase n=1 Tax=Streptomyces sp. NPDC057499 TaxID=3346150 RepID=UPI0036984D46